MSCTLLLRGGGSCLAGYANATQKALKHAAQSATLQRPGYGVVHSFPLRQIRVVEARGLPSRHGCCAPIEETHAEKRGFSPEPAPTALPYSSFFSFFSVRATHKARTCPVFDTNGCISWQCPPSHTSHLTPYKHEQVLVSCAVMLRTSTPYPAWREGCEISRLETNGVRSSQYTEFETDRPSTAFLFTTALGSLPFTTRRPRKPLLRTGNYITSSQPIRCQNSISIKKGRPCRCIFIGNTSLFRLFIS